MDSLCLVLTLALGDPQSQDYVTLQVAETGVSKTITSQGHFAN